MKKVQGWYRYYRFLKDRNSFKKKGKVLGAMGQRTQLIGLKDEEETRDLSDASSQYFISTEEFQLDHSKSIELSVYYDFKFNDLVLKAPNEPSSEASPNNPIPVGLDFLGIETRNVDEIQEVVNERLKAKLDKILSLFTSNLKTTSTPKNSALGPSQKPKQFIEQQQSVVEEDQPERGTAAIRDVRLSSMALIFQIRSFTMLKKIKVLAND